MKNVNKLLKIPPGLVALGGLIALVLALSFFQPAGGLAKPTTIFEQPVYEQIEEDERRIEFAGRTWIVKSGGPRGPGNNLWSDSEESVSVVGGQLHLKLRKIEGNWHSVEVYTEECTTYGKHRFFVVGRLDELDRNVVAGLFLYANDEEEIDIEFSKWGIWNSPTNGQYVVQPYDVPGNRHPFGFALNGTHSSHTIDWQPESIRFKSIPWTLSGATHDCPSHSRVVV